MYAVRLPVLCQYNTVHYYSAKINDHVCVTVIRATAVDRCSDIILNYVMLFYSIYIVTPP